MSNYCCWCGRYAKFMMPRNRFGEITCPVCSEEDGYIEHVKRLERLERTLGRRNSGSAIKPSKAL